MLPWKTVIKDIPKEKYGNIIKGTYNKVKNILKNLLTE
jgi:hypothetical protein